MIKREKQIIQENILREKKIKNKGNDLSLNEMLKVIENSPKNKTYEKKSKQPKKND